MAGTGHATEACVARHVSMSRPTRPKISKRDGTARRRIMLLDPDPRSRIWVKTALLDQEYEVSSFTSIEGALPVLQRDDHDLLFLAVEELSPDLPGLFSAIKRRGSALGVVITTSKASSLTRSFPELCDGQLGHAPLQFLERPAEATDLIAALRTLTRKLRWKRATGELAAIDASDSGVWR